MAGQIISKALLENSSSVTVFYTSASGDASVTLARADLDYLEIPPAQGKGGAPTLELFIIGKVAGPPGGVAAVKWSAVTRLGFQPP
jgi:hypothetical protein